MAKGNNKNKRQNNNGWFQQNIQRDGPDFIQGKTSQDIQRDYQRILRDLAYNQNNTAQISAYFMNRNFVTSLYNSASHEMYRRYAVFTGLTTYSNMMNANGYVIDPRVEIEKNTAEARQQYEAMALVVAELNFILNALNSGSAEEAIRNFVSEHVYALAAKLSGVKRFI